MADKYRDRGVVVLAVNAWDEEPAKVRRFVEQKGLKQTVLMNGRDVFYNQWKSKGIPQVYILDRQGRISDWHAGFSFGDEKELAAMIDKLL